MKAIRHGTFQGSENDVLDRFVQAAQKYDAELVVRITGDCPLVDPQIVDACVVGFLENGVDYFSNTLPPHFLMAWMWKYPVAPRWRPRIRKAPLPTTTSMSRHIFGTPRHSPRPAWKILKIYRACVGRLMNWPTCMLSKRFFNISPHASISAGERFLISKNPTRSFSRKILI